MSEAGLNDVLAAVSPIKGASVELGGGNRVRVRYGRLHAEATLPANVELGRSPRLTVVLSSIVVALSLRVLLSQPFISVQGRRVIVDLAAVPELAAVSPFWRHLREVRLSTSPNALQVSFDVEITE